MFLKSRKFIYYNKNLNEKARKLRNEMTPAEKKLWYEYLRKHQYNFFRQKPIGNYIVDFYYPKLNLVIEIDGETHLTDNEKNYDEQRTKDLNKYGLKLIRFWNDEVLRDLENVINKIEEEIDGNHPNPFLERGGR